MANTILISDTSIKKVALMIKINLRGRFSSVIVNLILVSMLFLFEDVKISIISIRYPVKMRAECIQFFACKNKIHPIVEVEDTKMILLADVTVNSWSTEKSVPKIRIDIVLGFISCKSISAPGNF
jgi:hypothetical protein